MSDAWGASLTQREDLNFPTAEEIRKALKKANGQKKDAVKLLRKQADGQPKRPKPDAEPRMTVIVPAQDPISG